MFRSGDFGDHPLLRATFRGARWLGLTVLAPRRSTDRAADVSREIKDGRLLVTVTRGGSKDELMLRPPANGDIAALRVIRTVNGKAVAEELRMT